MLLQSSTKEYNKIINELIFERRIERNFEVKISITKKYT